MKPIEELYQRVISNLEANLPAWLTYHNAQHTRYVFDQSVFIGQMERLSEKDLYLLKLAALFHDTGYLVNPQNHEEESCKIAEQELMNFGITNEEFQLICGMIMATRLPQNPGTLPEMILADADLEYLGTEKFSATSEKLFSELKHSRPDMTSDDWRKLQIDFLTKHSYFTAFCKNFREPIKRNHLKNLIEQGL